MNLNEFCEERHSQLVQRHFFRAKIEIWVIVRPNGSGSRSALGAGFRERLYAVDCRINIQVSTIYILSNAV